MVILLAFLNLKYLPDVFTVVFVGYCLDNIEKINDESNILYNLLLFLKNK